ncbi:MAG: glycosyltransferase family 4 protein [Minisyncoccota bacterium]
MKIAYITNASYIGGWAHSVQIVNMCKAFSDQNIELTLVVPNRSIYNKVDLFEYYNLQRTFKVKLLPCIDLSVGNDCVFFYWVRFLSFYISARVYVLFNNFNFLYSRDLYSSLFFPSIIIEQHSFPKKVNILLKYILSKKRKVVSLTSFIKNKFVSAGVPERNIIVAHSAVDLDNFKNFESKLNIEGINENNFVIGYVGTLKTMGMEKGVSDCIECLVYLPKETVLLVVGGESLDIEFYKNRAKEFGVFERVHFVGKVSHGDIPSYIDACDILLAPFPQNEHYSYFMSPLKIFEYMASKRPIISTTLPSIQEVLKHEHNALLIPPSDSKALAGAIERLSLDSGLANRISSQAYKDVTELYTWNKRAKDIVQFIKS